MRFVTDSGLKGELVEFVSTTNTNVPGLEGFVIIRRNVPERAFSTHAVYTNVVGHQQAEGGNYDMTLDEARKDLARRVGRP